LHLWDRTTEIEETLDAAAELTTAGHIRAFALSNVPAWYLGRADLLSRQRYAPRLAAVQLNYNLLTRHLESDFLDLLKLCEIDMISWGPLANGLLSGRYQIDRDRRTLSGSGRMKGAAFLTGFVDAFSLTSRNTLAELNRLAVKTRLTPAQIALAWLLHREQPASVVIGVSNEKQLAEQIEAASVTLDREVLDRLDAASRPSVPYPQRFLEPDMQVFIHGEPGARKQ
jgi:aryl-alcohol dehydrogenase-like predicted oxidoreductase